MSKPSEAENSEFPMADIEPELAKLRCAAAMLGHMATSAHEKATEDLHYLKSQFFAHHDRLEALWKQAWEERAREREAHAAELAAAKARTAPGSQAEAERVAGLWGMLAGAAQVVAELAAKAMPEGARLLAGDAVKLRDAVAPIDAELPPAESGRA